MDLETVKKVAIAPGGGNHGIEAFRLNLKVLIVVIESNGNIEVIKDDIDGISTVFCKKDSSEVIQKTIYDQLTADLRVIHDSSLILE